MVVGVLYEMYVYGLQQCEVEQVEGQYDDGDQYFDYVEIVGGFVFFGGMEMFYEQFFLRVLSWLDVLIVR